jgi:hypothetical protein
MDEYARSKPTVARSVTEITASSAGINEVISGKGVAANGANTANPRSNIAAPLIADRVWRGVGGNSASDI